MAQSGPRTGASECVVAFASRREAIEFLANLNGLSHEEQRQLARESKLKLQRQWHGAERCGVKAISLPEGEATKALAGELDAAA